MTSERRHVWTGTYDATRGTWTNTCDECGETRTITDEQIERHQVMVDLATGRPLVRGELTEDQRTVAAFGLVREEDG